MLGPLFYRRTTNELVIGRRIGDLLGAIEDRLLVLTGYSPALSRSS